MARLTETQAALCEAIEVEALRQFIYWSKRSEAALSELEAADMGQHPYLLHQVAVAASQMANAAADAAYAISRELREETS